MSVRKIIKIGDPLLRKNSENVHPDELGTKEFKKLIRDMFDTMRHAEGVGLAAPQIGILKKIVVVGSDPEDDGPVNSRVPERILINPEITPITESVDGNWEGCLSVPAMRGYVERPNQIKMKWMDEKGNSHEETFKGYPAIVYQHECDHLNGVLYVDRLKSTKLFGFNDSMELTGPIID